MEGVVWKASKNASDEVILDSLLMIEQKVIIFFWKRKEEKEIEEK